VPHEIAGYLESWEAPWFTSSRIAEDDGALVGFAAAEIDATLGRAWIYGPLVEYLTWDELAERLLDEVMAAVPATISDFELSGDVANVRLARLADRVGFAAGAVHFLLTLDAVGIEQLPPRGAQILSAEHEEAFVELHDALFPRTYYPGKQLLERAARGEQIVLCVIEGDELVGYSAGRSDEDGGYIDFIGVVPRRRGEGHGRTLVVALSRALHARLPAAGVSLTVSSENGPALALYDQLGFVQASRSVGYRRRAESAI
jgi:ribosomal protein S18 acetylase RimI-like enzyme